MKVKINRLKDSAIIPTRGSKEAAGYDLYACCNDVITIKPHETVKISTGLAIQPPAGYFGAIFSRSGLATKQGLRLSNCVGVCDQDYLGEYIVALHNDTDQPQTINPNDRIAQVVFLPYINIEFCETDKFDSTERDTGGFGSTGK